MHRGNDAIGIISDNPQIVGAVPNNQVVGRLVSFELDALTIGAELIIGQQRGDGLDIIAARPFQPEGPARHPQQSSNRGSRICLQTSDQQIEPSADVRSSLNGVGITAPQMQAGLVQDEPKHDAVRVDCRAHVLGVESDRVDSYRQPA
ncbi:hypothetical protein [Arthrobacter sp. Hiyo1]|uniref:hypothetical protein n=1 Tax=Arthrobacter sp. Hiyo1 TaxID=1588020 RepID=UPI0030F3EBFE